MRSQAARLERLEKWLPPAPPKCPACHDLGGQWPIGLHVLQPGEGEPIAPSCLECGRPPAPDSGIRQILIGCHEQDPEDVVEPPEVEPPAVERVIPPPPNLQAKKDPEPSREVPNQPPSRIGRVWKSMTSPDE